MRFFLGAVLLALAGSLEGQEKAGVSIEAREPWSNVFADKKLEFHFTVAAPGGFVGRAGWTIAAGEGRVLAGGRGETALKIAAKGQVKIKVPWHVPPVKEGVVLKAKITLTVTAEGKEEAAAGYEKIIWIFHNDPFFARKKWLEERKLALWDPDPKGKTAAAFKKLEIPFEELANVAGLGERKEGIIVVGEGASFKEEPALAEALVQAAARGIPVLCLAPGEGSFPLPGASEAGGPVSPRALSLRRLDIITRLDKRLDADSWADDGKVQAASLALKAEEGKVVAEVQPGPGGWPWLEAEFPKGRLLVCGFGLIGHWETSPTPRYLLARLLEHLNEEEKAKGSDSNNSKTKERNDP